MAKLLHIRLIEAKNLPPFDSNGNLDSYVKFKIPGEKQKSKTAHKTLQPVFNEEFTFILKEDKGTMECIVSHHGFLKKPLCYVHFEIAELIRRESMHGWFYLTSQRTKKPIPGAAVNLTFLVEAEAKITKPIIQRRSETLLKIAKLKEEAKKISDPKGDDAKDDKIRLFIGSWNVGNAVPPEDLSPWIPKTGYDVYAIGAQECSYDARKPYDSCAADWVGTLTAHLGKDDFELVETSHLWQIRLVIFIRKSLYGCVHNVEKSTEATGIASVMGNKGGTAVSFTLNDISLCFVNTHLAAHQHKVDKRNEDVAEVIKGIKMGAKQERMDILNQYHHVFWCGDLNYRLDFGDQEGKEPTKELFDKMVKMVEKKQFKELFDSDQLAAEMKGSRVFRGFTEGFPNFEPTFKVEREEGIKYNEKRSPAWCDRILWRSFPGYHVEQTSFQSAPRIITSDHKPVYGTFVIDQYPLADAWDSSLGAVTLKWTKLEAHKLPAGDVGGKSDPFVRFVAPFISGSVSTTAIKKNTLEPVWEEKELKPIQLTINNKARLEKSFIWVRVYDWDATSASDLLCESVLPLKSGLSGEKTEIKLELTSGGLPAGTLEGEFILTWDKIKNQPPTTPPASPAKSPEK